MTENPEPGSGGKFNTGGPEDASQSDVTSEFRQLGRNLKEILEATWESEERRKLQREIESGLSELGRSLNQTVEEFKESPTGKRIQSEAEDLRGRIRSGELEAQLREDLLSILRRVNTELEKAAERTHVSSAETDAPEES
jgi:HD-GYP domain-containing protein (c-di-GMP phosphodiesterase class II)